MYKELNLVTGKDRINIRPYYVMENAFFNLCLEVISEN